MTGWGMYTAEMQGKKQFTAKAQRTQSKNLEK